ncbi:MAG: TAXI family TRAP transporter solute-binding subunit [Planctomycetota bacterium]|nr:TAXI family TRAP transporter solute-binding subunit [Planctomycetota bacterium]
MQIHCARRWLRLVAIGMMACCAALRGGEAAETDSGGKLGYPGRLNIVTGPRNGQWSALGNVLAELLTDAGIPSEARIGGGVENLKLVGDGEADVGFTLYSFLGAAGAGSAELPVVNLDNAVLLANLYPQVLYLIVRTDVAREHNLKSLGDLLKIKGKLRFSTLPKGTGSEFIFNMLLKSAYLTDYDKLAEQGWEINFQSYDEITRLFLAGELDVCAYTAGPGTYLIPALEKANLDAILLPVEEEMLDLMTHQFMTITYVIEKGDYKSVPEDVVTLGDYSSLVVQNAIPEDMVYNLNKVLWENRMEMGRVSEDIENLSPRFAIAGQSKVHPGSIRFWNSPEMEELKSRRTRR